jgi:hypothetical protein
MTLDQLIAQAQALRAAGVPGDAVVCRRFMGNTSHPPVDSITAARRYVLWNAEEQQQRDEPLRDVVLLD